MDFSTKLKAIRLNEGLTQLEFCEVAGINISTLKKYEIGLFEMGYSGLHSLLSQPRFFKYTLWLITDQVAPELGQVCPE